MSTPIPPRQESNPEQAGSNNIDDFLKEVETPTIPSMDSIKPGVQQASGFNDVPVGPPAPPPYVPPAGSPPVFDNDDIDQTGSDDLPPTGPVKPKRSADYQDKVIRGFIDGEEYLTSRLTAAVVGADDAKPFMYSEDDKNTLQILTEPFKDWIIDKCPAALPLFLVYAGLKTDQVLKASKVYKINKANKAGKQDAGTMGKVATAMKDKGERTNFVLYKDGYYRNSPSGIYVGRDDKEKLEKPNIKDLEKILAAKANRHADLLCAAFDITEADFSRLGIVLND